MNVEIIKQFEALLPPSEGTLSIVHDQHRNFDQSAGRYCDQAGLHGAWKDEDAKRRAIETDSVWELQWHPRAPLGFNLIFAPTLRELIEFAQEIIA